MIKKFKTFYQIEDFFFDLKFNGTAWAGVIWPSDFGNVKLGNFGISWERDEDCELVIVVTVTEKSYL